MKKRYIIHVIMPLFIGGLLYVLFRDNNLKMFNWFYQIGIGGFVESIRMHVLPLKYYFPSWVLYNLPGSLWTYSLTVFIIFNFNRRLDRTSFFWISLGPLLSIGMEILQLFGLIKGTFDITDLIFYIIAIILSFSHISNIKQYYNRHEQKKYIVD